MATLNVGAMAARLGLDPSEFLSKMKDVEGFNSGLQNRMSAEMKRTNREGAESFRLIDESIGLHVSRPLTRILTSTFPSFAKGLQSILGVGVVGALGAVGFEAWDHLTRKVDEAKRKIEEFHEATRNLQSVVENAADSWALKIARLGGRNSLAAVASEGAAEARHQIDELGKSIDNLYAKSVAANNFWTKLWGETGGEILSTPKSKTEDANKQQFAELQQKIDEALRADTLNGTTNAMKAIRQEMDANIAKAGELKKEMAENDRDPFAHPSLLTGKEQLEGLKAQKDFLDKAQADEAGREKFQGLQNAKNAAEAARKAIHDMQEEMKGWNEENNRAFEAWIRLNAELDKSVEKLNSEAFKDFNKRAESQRAQFAPWMTQQVLPPGGAPMLPDQAELAKVTADQNESWKKAGEILAQIETPAQRYATGLATIKELQAEGRLTADQVALATQQLDQQMVKAADSVHKLQEEMMKLLERSDSAKDGLKAFWLELQINGAENGKFAFSFASTMFKDFEDGIARTILATRNQHAELRRMWESYFRGLEEMALKFALSKSFASLANLASPNAGGGQNASILRQEQAQGNKMANWKGILAKVLGLGISAAIGGPAGLADASQMFFSAGGGAGQGAWGAPVAMSAIPDSIPLMAGGGDVSPGASFISGEAGAERIDLSRGGAHVTPLGIKGGGGETNIHNDFRGTVMTDDLMRRAEALQAMRASEERSVARAVSMQSEIAKRSRPPR